MEETQLNSLVSDSHIVNGIAIGQKLGLFNILCEQETPISVDQLAKQSSCKPTLIRQWLLLMTASKITTMPTDDQFILPVERRPAFQMMTSAAVHLAPYVPILEGESMMLLKSMKKNVPSAFASQVESGFDSDLLYVEWQIKRPAVFKEYLKTMLSLAHNLKEKLEKGAKVLDIGTYDGKLVKIAAEQFPKSEFIGIDISEKCIKAIDNNLPNASFQIQDALCLPDSWTEQFDYVTIIDAFLHLPDTEKAAEQVKRVLKPGGWLSIVEINRETTYEDDMKLPNAAVNYLFELIWCDEGETHSHAGHDASVLIPNAIEYIMKTLNGLALASVQREDLPRVDLDDVTHILCRK